MDSDRAQSMPRLTQAHTPPPAPPDAPPSKSGPSSERSFDAQWRFPLDPDYQMPPINPAREWPSLKPPPTPRLSTATTPEFSDGDSDFSDLEPLLTPAASSVADATEEDANDEQAGEDEHRHEQEDEDARRPEQLADRLAAILLNNDVQAEAEEVVEVVRRLPTVSNHRAHVHLARNNHLPSTQGFESLDEKLQLYIGTLVFDDIRIHNWDPDRPLPLTTSQLDQNVFTQPPITRVSRRLRNLLLPNYYEHCFVGIVLMQQVQAWPRPDTELARFLASIPRERHAMLKGIYFRIVTAHRRQDEEYFRQRHELNELLGHGWTTREIHDDRAGLGRPFWAPAGGWHHTVELCIDRAAYPPAELGIDDDYPGRGRTRYRQFNHDLRQMRG